MVKDKLDLKILASLQENARLSYADLGRKVGLSASAVKDRVQRLEDTGVIKSYNVTLDHKKIGYPMSAYISLKIGHGKLKSFLDSLDQFPEIVDCSRVTGSNCLVILVFLKGSDHLEKLIDRLIKYGEPTTNVVLSNIVDDKKLDLSNAESFA